MGRVTMGRVALFALATLCLPIKSAHAEEIKPTEEKTLSVAVIPYLTIGISDNNSIAISEVLAREVAANTGAKVKAGEQIRNSLPPLPDGCPSKKICTDKVASTLEVDHLLFVLYLGGEASIEVSLVYIGGGEERQTKFSLQLDPSNWNDSIREGLLPVLPKPEIVPLPIPVPPKRGILTRWWFWGSVGGVVAAGVTGVLLLQPSLGFAN